MVDLVEGEPLVTLVDTATSTTIVYIGKAVRGTATSAASWLIKSIDTTSGAEIKWASADADQIWDNRVSLTYT